MIIQKEKKLIKIEINQRKKEGLIKKTDLENKLKYYEVTENNKLLYRYSLTKCYIKTNNVNYKCFDTKCKGQISIKIDIKHQPNEQLIKEKNIKEIYEYDLEMEEHNYIRNTKIKEELNILGNQLIVKKCYNFNYLKGLIREVIIQKNIINIKALNAKKLLYDKFGDIVINYK